MRSGRRLAPVAAACLVTGCLLAGCGSSPNQATIASQCQSAVQAQLAQQPTSAPRVLTTPMPFATSIIGSAAMSFLVVKNRLAACTFVEGSGVDQTAVAVPLVRFTRALQVVGTAYLSSTQGWAILHYSRSVHRIAFVGHRGATIRYFPGRHLALLTFRFPKDDLGPYGAQTTVGAVVGFTDVGWVTGTALIKVAYVDPLGGFWPGASAEAG